MSLSRRRLALRIVPLLAFLVGCSSPVPGTWRPPVPAPSPPEGYGLYERPAGTSSALAQAWMDHGLTLLYGFHHDSGVEAYRRAAVLDPGCAMAWWGIAYGSGVDVNDMSVSDEDAKAAADAAEMAMGLVQGGSGVERGLVEAVAARAVFPLPEDRSVLDQAYADRLAQLWREHPGDADVGTLYAEALMNLQPWDYWTADGAPIGRAEEIVATLERVLELAPDHPGASHFYIHAVEASSDPARALGAAKTLETRIPGSGHLVHMPSHVYITTGHYDEAVRSNQDAIRADEAYFESYGRTDGYGLYFLHNIHFLAFAAMMEGRSELALAAVRRMEDEVSPSYLAENPGRVDGLLPSVFHVLIRFGLWQEILEEPEYQDFRRVSRAVRRYARAMALANLGRPEEARAELAAFDVEAAQVPADWAISLNPASVILGLSRRVAEGEILFQEGKTREAFAVLEKAQAVEDALVYDEPPGWMLPVRHARGALLLAAGQAEVAEQVYREDLEEWPRNGWSLLGRQQALRALGRLDEARAMDVAVAAAWQRADVSPPASCYCGAAGEPR